MYFRQVLLFIGLAIVAPLYTQANYVNITVDDSHPDPNFGGSIIYSPDGGWSTGDKCNFGCSVKLDPSKVYSGTWHDSTFSAKGGTNNVPNQPLYADFQFVGVGVYVYAVLRGGSKSDMTFYINGTQYGTYSFAPFFLQNGQYQYNTSVFSYSLPQGTHNLRIQNGHVDGPDSLMLLDYITYTHDYYA